jgi:hypothetical protein
VSVDGYDVHEYRRRRNHDLELESEFLRAERIRLERLLAVALRVAVGGTAVSPLALLDALAERRGTDLAHPAWMEQRQERHTKFLVEKTIRLLREIA